ncbi:MAG: L,D-transpeptidase family protein [Candidatus Omnitrophica bacterium]|nr:L,D-transpeptidase family protein [Candidatus Omnitrophota bacterium]
MNRRVAVAAIIGLIVFIVVAVIISQSKKGTNVVGEFKSEASTLYNTAVSLQSKGNVEEAVKLYQELVKKYPQDKRAADVWYRLAKVYAGSNLWTKAKEAYSNIIANFPNYENIAEVEKNLWDANVKIIFSPIITEKDFTYSVQPGDTLGKIAAKHNTTVDLIMKSNNLDSAMIRVGKRLKLSTIKFSVIVDKSQNMLTLRADDEIFKVYSVATGKYNCTPVGNFQVVEKLINPDWYKEGVGVVSADSPENVLGTRWIGLSEPQYGIHGGAAEEDLGRQVTEGCVRMINTDVEELFTILPRGAEITIVD